MTALAIVDAEVRELIRRRGLDPEREGSEVRRLIEDVLADYSVRSAHSPLPAIGDPKATARALYDTVAGLGPLQGSPRRPRGGGNLDQWARSRVRRTCGAQCN